MLSKSSSRHVKSVQTAFRIINVLQNQDGATINELTNQLDVAKSTVHNYLSTLESMGYVVDQNGTYRIGLRFLTHGMAARKSLGIGGAVTSALSEVATEISQAVWWVSEEFGRGIFVDMSVPDDGQVIYGRVGKRSYLHAHAPGKAILSQLSREYVQEVIEHHGLPVHTNQTVTDLDTLLAELDEISEQGYAFTDGEVALGVQSIGVPFEDQHGRTHAIGVFGYSHDFGGESLDEDILAVLQMATADIVTSLQGEGGDR